MPDIPTIETFSDEKRKRAPVATPMKRTTVPRAAPAPKAAPSQPIPDGFKRFLQFVGGLLVAAIVLVTLVVFAIYGVLFGGLRVFDFDNESSITTFGAVLVCLVAGITWYSSRVCIAKDLRFVAYGIIVAGVAVALFLIGLLLLILALSGAW